MKENWIEWFDREKKDPQIIIIVDLSLAFFWIIIKTPFGVGFFGTTIHCCPLKIAKRSLK